MLENYRQIMTSILMQQDTLNKLTLDALRLFEDMMKIILEEGEAK